MKCHWSYYIYKGKKKKCLIPMCYNVVHSDNIDDCTCREPSTAYQFERKRFQEVVDNQRQSIIELEEENKRLIEIIKQLK